MAQIDTSIYNRIQRPGQALSNIAQGVQGYRQNQMNALSMQQQQLKLQEQQREKEKAEDFKRRQAQYQQALSLDPMMSPEAKQDLESRIFQPEMLEQRLRSGLRGGNTAGQWVNIPGRPGWKMNKVTGEEVFSKAISETISPQEQSKMDDRTLRRAETKTRREQQLEENQRNYDLSREKMAVQMETLKEKRGEKTFTQANKLSSFHHKNSTEYIKQRNAMDRIVASAEDPSAAGDLALIFNYMKVLDPGSTVREGEFATAEGAAGVDDRTLNIYNKIRTGQKLGVAQRADFVKRAGLLFNKAERNQTKLDKQVRQKAKLFNIDPELVMYDYSSAEDPSVSVSPKLTNANQSIADEILRELEDMK